jgi:hypothetical protein
MKPAKLSEAAWIVGAAALIGAGLAALQPGSFWRGWAAFGALLVIGFVALRLAVGWAGGGRTLAIMAGIAMGLRLLVGTTLYVVLPLDGHDDPDDRAGHVFTDAHRRDDQAWELAASDAPLWAAFDRGYYTDQYGGLLAGSALIYRLLSPDSHRALLILTLAALFAALGVPFFFRAAQRLWGGGLPAFSSWLYCLYPESVLTGGAQMREPFLLTFIAIALWGFTEMLEQRSRSAWVWLIIGLVGLVALSPGIALATVVLLTVWLRARGAPVKSAPVFWTASALVGVTALLLLALSVRTTGPSGGTAIGVVARWFQDSVTWVIYELERGSGQVQNVFSQIMPGAQFVFVLVYGITQPLLPPAIFEPTTGTWHAIGILRSIGWYALLPVLLYAPISLWGNEKDAERRVWIWLAVFSWLWILICAVRAGGDQWDNPRYRLIFFGVQALIAARAWLSWRARRDAWLPRIVAAEIVCLLLFSQWYVSRYYLIGIHFPILVVMGMCIASVLVIFLGGAAWDHLRKLPRRP